MPENWYKMLDSETLQGEGTFQKELLFVSFILSAICLLGKDSVSNKVVMTAFKQRYSTQLSKPPTQQTGLPDGSELQGFYLWFKSGRGNESNLEGTKTFNMDLHIDAQASGQVIVV